MRRPSTSTSAENGAAPLPSSTVVLAISVRSIVPSLSGPTIALARGLQRHLAEPVDDEPHAIARHRELRRDAAAGHHDHAGLEPAAATVEEIRQPRHGLEGVAHRAAGLALARGVIVDPAARHCVLPADATPLC